MRRCTVTSILALVISIAFVPIVCGQSAEMSPERIAARKELGQLMVPYGADSFVKQAWEGDTLAVKLFLAAGMDPNSRGNDNGSALQAALSARRADIAKLLLDAGATPLPDDWNAVLNSAGRTGNADAVRRLLEKLPDLYRQDAVDSALTAAIVANSDVVGLLLDHGANANASNSHGASALAVAAAAGDARSVELLLGKGAAVNQPNARDWDGATPLMVAAAAGDLAMVRALVDHGADVKARSFKGLTALICAARALSSAEFYDWVGVSVSKTALGGAQRADIVNALLDKGADVNAEDFQGDTALIEAVKSGRPDAVKALLSARADLNANDSEAIYEAVRLDRPDLARLLVAAGADPNGRSHWAYGATLLFAAAGSGKASAVKALLDLGADVNAVDRDGLSPLMAALRNKHPEIARMLLLAPSIDVNLVEAKWGDTALFFAAQSSQTGLAQRILDKGADVNFPAKERETPLMEAARGGHIDMVRLLLARGANVNARDASGNTALSFASKYNTYDMAKLLVSAGAK